MDDLQSYLDALKGQQSMTHQAEPPPDMLQNYIQSLHGVDVTPQHLPGTQPKDYLRELYQNPDLLAKNVDQASNFNFGGIMAGPLAQTANRADLALASRMGKEGFPREQIHDATKWFLGADKNPKFEISDQGMIAKPLPKTDRSIMGSLEQFIHHDELFKAYPHLRELKVAIDPDLPKGLLGKYEPDIGKITIGGNVDQKGLTTQQQKTLLHEIQHNIQEKEGFAQGTNPEYAYEAVKQALWNKFNKMPGTHPDADTVFTAINHLLTFGKDVGDHMYWRTPGEVESRNVADRFMSGNKGYPWKTEDIPQNKQFEYVKKALGR